MKLVKKVNISLLAIEKTQYLFPYLNLFAKQVQDLLQPPSDDLQIQIY